MKMRRPRWGRGRRQPGWWWRSQLHQKKDATSSTDAEEKRDHLGWRPEGFTVVGWGTEQTTPSTVHPPLTLTPLLWCVEFQPRLCSRFSSFYFFYILFASFHLLLWPLSSLMFLILLHLLQIIQISCSCGHFNFQSRAKIVPMSLYLSPVVWMQEVGGAFTGGGLK